MTVSPLMADPDTLPVEMQSEHGGVDVEEILGLVTRDWVNQALNVKYPRVSVERMKVARIVAGCATKIWVNLSYDDAGDRAGLPSSMIVKAGFDRHDPVMLFTYLAEMQAYRDVLPVFPVNAPICYYAGSGPGSVSAAIIMEDLCLRDVRFCHAARPLAKAEAAAFLEAMAETHARSWQHPSLTDGSWDWPQANQDILASLGEYFAMLQSEEQWAHYMALPRCTAISKTFHDRDRFLSALSRLNERSASAPKVAMIGDTHLSNLYIEADGKAGFLDFQSRVGPWAQEVAYFMGAALDMVDRRSWERELLQYYLDRLAAYGVTPPSFSSAWDSYCENLLFGLFVWMTNGEHFQTEAVNAANAARLAAAAIDHDTLGRLSH